MFVFFIKFSIIGGKKLFIFLNVFMILVIVLIFFVEIDGIILKIVLFLILRVMVVSK